MKTFYLSNTLWLSVFFAMSAHAAEPASTQSHTDTNTYVAGVRVAIDPATGRLRPLTDAESKALSSALLSKRSLAESKHHAQRYGVMPVDESAAQKTVRVNKNGSVSARVPASSIVQIRAVIDADGNLRLLEGDDSSKQEVDL